MKPDEGKPRVPSDEKPAPLSAYGSAAMRFVADYERLRAAVTPDERNEP